MKFQPYVKQSVPQFLALMAVLALAACGGREGAPTGSSGAGGYYKVGKPYQIKGSWYYPKEDYSYDETGIASWYGSDFHALKTANGETYNKNELTAAHKTLPMPSLARVTNLENGRSIVVRVNDRGPFSGARIIDVSQRSAQLLGFEKQGTAKVRVQVLADESKAIAEAMRTYGTSPPQTTEQMVASAQQAPQAAEPYTSPYANASVQTAALDQPTSFGVAPSTSTTPAQPLTVSTVKPVPTYVQVPVTGNNQIYVQAGAFTNMNNATRLQAALGKVGRVNVVEALVKGVQYYRVRVGPIESVALADKTLKQVLKSGAENARIIVD